MKKLLLIILIIPFIISCNNNKQVKDSIKIGNTRVNSTVIDKRVNDSIEFELGDIAENLQIVRLETSKSILLGNIYRIVLGENYLVIGTESDYYLFDRKGKYIRRLFITGRGPEEFNSPLFSKVIRNDILYISDGLKSRRYIYSIDLNTAKQSRILRAEEGTIQSFIPDSDTTFLIISGKFSVDNNYRKWSSECSLLKQNFQGVLLNNLALGTYKGNGLFGPSTFSMYANGGEVMIQSPRCDSILRFSNFKVLPIWRNTYETNFDEHLTTQKVPDANLVHYSEDTILLWKQSTVYDGNMTIGGKVQFLLMDRVNDKLIAVKNLFFKDKTKPINIARINLLSNDRFAMVISADDMDSMLKNPLFKEPLERILITDSTGLQSPITSFDNPFILLGKFK
jgi:hypothetical protein